MANIELLYPVNLKLSDKMCLVVGGGDEALRSIRSLLESGARVKVISKRVLPEINTLNRMHVVTWSKKSFAPSDLKNVFLVIAATNTGSINNKISNECNKKNLLVTVAKNPPKGNFNTPPMIRRGNLMFTVSTGGQSPSLASAIKKELETRYGREYARFLKFLGDIKGDVKDKLLGSGIQKELYQKLVRPEIMDLQARRNLRKFLDEVKKIFNT